MPRSSCKHSGLRPRLLGHLFLWRISLPKSSLLIISQSSIASRAWCLSTNTLNSSNAFSVPTPSTVCAVNICLHIGQRPRDSSCSSHWWMQWRWKLWVHPLPNTRGQSSPGYLQLGHVPSNGTRQIPQSSSPPSLWAALQCHVATPCQFRMCTFMAIRCKDRFVWRFQIL